MPQWIEDIMSAWPAIGIIFVLIWIGVKITPVARKVSHFVDDMAGEPARNGRPAQPSLMERVAIVEHEVKDNHGSSLKDAIKRMEKEQTVSRAEQASLRQALDEHIQQSAPIAEQVQQLHAHYIKEKA